MNIVSVLQELGDEMLGEPITGTLTLGNNTSLAVYPDTTGEWTLQILLHEGASSDLAAYAAAVFRTWLYL